MPKRAPSLCPHCGKAHTGVCPQRAAAVRERKARADANRPTARERGYDKDWQRLRANWLAVHPSCARCGRKADLVDHIIPIRQAPHRRLDPTNLQSLCTSCHSGAKQAADRRNERSP